MYISSPCGTRAISWAIPRSGAVAAWTLAILLLAAVVFWANSARAQATDQAGAVPVLIAMTLSDDAAILEFDGPTALSIRHLSDPYRVVIDLPVIGFATDPSAVVAPGSITSVRFGRVSAERSRILLTFKSPVWAVGDDGGSTSTARTAHRIAFSPVEPTDFAALVESDAGVIDGISAAQGNGPVETAGVFTLAIDPGHGGIDGGAEGELGTIEKDVTLAFAKALKSHLAQDAGIRVVMTREDDVFVSLRERVEFARKTRADLLLSVHADSIDVPGLRGATIYTLSDSASDAISRRLAEQENLSDTIAGLPPESAPPEVNDILVDLLKRETGTFSSAVARELIVHLEANSVNLINNPLRSAGFRVLTAPDVPSLLLEMGYLSNAEDEKLMRDVAWRERMAEVLATAIRAYAKDHRLNAGFAVMVCRHVAEKRIHRCPSGH